MYFKNAKRETAYHNTGQAYQLVSQIAENKENWPSHNFLP